MKSTRSVLPILIMLAVPCLAWGAEDADPSLESMRPFLQRYCLDCHRGESAESSFDLANLVSEPRLSNADSFDHWVKVHDRVEAGEMPPPHESQPDASERQRLLRTLSRALQKTNSAKQSEQGRVQLRRLNRVEYEYTLRDLFALPNLQVADMLPADAQSDGFDTVGATLNLSYVQMSHYLEAATVALDQAMMLGPQPTRHLTHLPAKNNGRLSQVLRKAREAVAIDDAVGLLRQPNSAQAPWWWSKFAPPSDGVYRLRMKVFGFTWDRGQVLPPDRPHALTFLGVQQSTKRPLGTFDVLGSPEHPVVIEFDAYLRRGDEIQFWIETLSDRTKPDNIDMPDYTSAGVAVEWLEVDGPINQMWPPASYKRLFGSLPTVPWTPDSGCNVPPLPMIIDGVGKRAKRVRTNPKKISLYRVVSETPQRTRRD